MMMMEDFKKEIQENTGNSQKPLKKKHKNPLESYKKSTTKQVMELNKTIQNLKREVETIKKTKSETTLEIETLERNMEPQMRGSATEYKRWKRESQVQKIPQGT